MDVLELDVVLTPEKAKKRRFDEVDADSTLDGGSLQEAIKSGGFDAVETCLFENGVKMFGWGSWSKIADLIPGRDRQQVRTFSRRVDVRAKWQPHATRRADVKRVCNCPTGRHPASQPDAPR